MKVLVTDPISDAGLARLRDAGYEVVTDYEVDTEGVIEQIADVDGLLIRGTEITREVFEAAPDLQIVSRAGIGVDNIDIPAATDHGVIVANAPRGNVRAAAELTIGLAFNVASQVPQAHQRLIEGEWAKDDITRSELGGMTVGIVGLGRLGQEVAWRFDNLGLDVAVYDPYLGADRADQMDAELLELDELLETVDILSVQARLTEETRGLIGPEEIDRFEGDFVILTSRGGIIDEPALAEAVESGRIKGAGVDVYSEEPPGEDHPFMDVENIITTPHLGAKTRNAQVNVAVTAADQIVDALNGELVKNAINVPSVEATAYPRIRNYVEVAETASLVAMRLFDGRVEEIEITYAGDIADEDLDLVTAAVFKPYGWQDQVVNAPARIAERRGIDVTESRRRETKDFRNLLSVTVSDGDDSLTVSGTLYAGEDPRIVEIDGYRVDAELYGYILLSRNRDEPGVIGTIGRILGEHDVNIASMSNARESIDGEALTVYNLDDPIDDDVVAELLEDDRIVDVTLIDLEQ
ncbi:phosphoglycerate dehydrogenase [Halapricum desulfuricans]|uniref:D-3-phosphoglycerate dehydrogenase n=1 Tax=Halapricum desulfuricans TaxID=2841257 RepID=A0A897MWF7_9EURY|nr:phosphoglycerate dehydrogenase [Halapricum desulfuricans]QSG04814.1 Phosphoglycerate dehydrogenase or related dehydrogenase [Halapricum desulfuricans]